MFHDCSWFWIIFNDLSLFSLLINICHDFPRFAFVHDVSIFLNMFHNLSWLFKICDASSRLFVRNPEINCHPCYDVVFLRCLNMCHDCFPMSSASTSTVVTALLRIPWRSGRRELWDFGDSNHGFGHGWNFTMLAFGVPKCRITYSSRIMVYENHPERL